MNIRPLAFAAPAALAACLCACISHRSTQVRVMSDHGGGIADATVQFNPGRSDDGDGALNGKSTWTTDAAGRAHIDYKGGGNGGRWRIEAEGFRPLKVDASPDEIRVRQYGSRAKNHDAEPLIFTLERNPPNAASDPKRFESGVGKPKADENKAAPKKDAKFEA